MLDTVAAASLPRARGWTVNEVMTGHGWPLSSLFRARAGGTGTLTFPSGGGVSLPRARGWNPFRIR